MKMVAVVAVERFRRRGSIFSECGWMRPVSEARTLCFTHPEGWVEAESRGQSVFQRPEEGSGTCPDGQLEGRRLDPFTVHQS